LNFSFIPAPSDRPHVGAGGKLAEDLLDVDLHGVRYEAVIAENDAQRFAASKLLSYGRNWVMAW
jgi:hypothetical protein